MSDNMKLGLVLTYNGKAVAGGAAENTQQVKAFGEAAKKSGADAAQGFDRVTLSAKQTSAALRQMPMQFTDIFTSLAAGQNPMQVMLQQGGQLKDLFGGIAPAARALGGYVAGLVTPMTVGAAAVAGLAVAYVQGRRESEEMARSIILTGNAAGTTAGQMQGYARTVADATGVTRGAAADAMTQMVATGKVSGDMLARVTEAAVRLQRSGGPAIEETVNRFAELGKAPLAASLKLNEQTNYLTTAVYLQIKALQEQNDTAGAAALAQSAYAEAGKKMAAEMEKNLGTLERAWRGITEEGKRAWDAMLGIGRKGDPVAAAADAVAVIKAKIADLSKPENAAYDPATTQAELKDQQLLLWMAEKRLAALKNTAQAETAAATAAGAGKDAFDKQVKAIAEADKSATHQVAMLKNSLDLLKAAPDSADKTRRELELTRQIRDLYHNMGAEERALANARIDGALKQAEILQKAASAHLTAQNKRGDISDRQAVNAQALIAEQQINEQIAALEKKSVGPAPAEQAKKMADIRALEAQRVALRLETEDKLAEIDETEGRSTLTRGAAQAKARGDLESAYLLEWAAKNGLAMQKAAAEGNQAVVDQLRTELGTGFEQARFDEAKQKFDLLFEQLKARRDAAREEGERDGGWLAGIRVDLKVREIDDELIPALRAAREEMVRTAGLSPVNQKTADTAKLELQKTANEISPIWRHAVEGIDRTFHDGFSRMLETGKGSWRAFADSLANTFKTTVADAAYQLFARPFVFQAVASAAGAMGFSGAANAFGGGGGASGASGSAGNLFSMGSSAANLFGGGSSLYGAFATSQLGGALGLSAAADFTGAATLTELGMSIGAALPWVGGALAVGSMLGLFGGGGDDPHNNPQATGYHFTLSKAGVSGAAGLASPSSFVAGPTSGAGWWGDNSALSAEQVAALNKQTAVAFAQGEALALSLGLDPALADKASVISTLHGNPSNGAIAGYFSSIEQAFTALADSIANNIIPNLTEFQAAGESLAQTASRLSQEFALTNKMAALMGHDAATAFGSNNLQARDQLVQMLGGLSGATSTLGSYYQNYHSESERQADSKGAIASTLRAIGIADVPTTREQFRALVEGQDLATEAGRTMYATLLSVADAFAGITTSADAAAKALGTDRFRTRADYIFAQKTGVMPAYAGGGVHAGGWAVVGEAGPEVAYMPPSRVYSNSDSKALLDLSQVTQAIDALRADLLAANAAIARAVGKTAKALDKWDVDGMPAVRV